MLFPFKCLLQCKLNPKTLSDSPHSYHSVYVSWNRHGWLHQRSVIFMQTLNMSQPSPASTHRSVWPTNPLSILSRAQGPWLSTNWRCALDRLQKMSVTGLGRGGGTMQAAPLQGCQASEGREKHLTSQNTQPLFGLGHWKSVDSQCVLREWLLPFPPPSPSWLCFWEGSSLTEESPDKGCRAGERPGKHHHSFVHTSAPFQGVPRVCQSQGDRKRRRYPLFFAKPWIYEGAREGNGNRIQGLTEAMGDASRTKNGEGRGEDPRSTDLQSVRCGLSVLGPMGFPVDWDAASQGHLCMDPTAEA